MRHIVHWVKFVSWSPRDRGVDKKVLFGSQRGPFHTVVTSRIHCGTSSREWSGSPRRNAPAGERFGSAATLHHAGADVGFEVSTAQTWQSPIDQLLLRAHWGRQRPTRPYSKPDAMPRGNFGNHGRFAVIRPYRTLSPGSIEERRLTIAHP
jgi:hypothetical protein